MAKGFQTLPGFRDFTPEDCAIRNYLFDTWRKVARLHGFTEYETPLLEDTELYLKKSGGELSTQLFRFKDQGDRDVTLRPEVTASLARLATSVQRDYPKPLKWFEIGQCFRYEKPQKGRGREFYQFNADLIGDPSPAADAELISLAIATMLELGFTKDDFTVRLSNRDIWYQFAQQKGFDHHQFEDFLRVIDKLERDPTARGYGDFLNVDLSIVRGLAYYTGTVFEIFDKKGELRAVAGGGRYDELLGLINPKAPLPATGFAMGDMVIRHLIEATPQAKGKMLAHLQSQRRADLFIVTADETHRPESLRLSSELRAAGINTDLALTAAKIPKQFKAAEQSRAQLALVIGAEFPELKLKNLATGNEETIPPNSDPIEIIKAALNSPDINGPLLAYVIGCGFREKAYERALVREFQLNNIPCDQQKEFPQFYKDTQIDTFIPDLIAYEKIIIDLKTIDQIGDQERGQILNYLKATNLQVGLILNFKKPKLEFKRFARTNTSK